MPETTPMTLGDAIQRAGDMLAGRKTSPDDVLKIVKVLHAGRKFGLARVAAPSVESGRARRDRAAMVRRAIVDRVAPLEREQTWLAGTWWFLVTIGEAFFGLEEFDRAGEWLMRAAALPNVPDWEREA